MIGREPSNDPITETTPVMFCCYKYSRSFFTNYWLLPSSSKTMVRASEDEMAPTPPVLGSAVGRAVSVTASYVENSNSGL